MPSESRSRLPGGLRTACARVDRRLQACLARGNALCVAAARNAAAERRVRAQPGHEFGPLLEVNDVDLVEEFHSSPNPLLASGTWW